MNMEMLIQLLLVLCKDDAYKCLDWFASATEYKNDGLLTESLQELNKIKVLFEEKLKKNDKLLGYLYNEIAIILAKQHNLDEAIKFYKKAIWIISKNGGIDCHSSTIIYNNIAKLYLFCYEYTSDPLYYYESMKYYNNLIKIMKQVHGYNSTIVKKFLIKTGHRIGHFRHYSDALKCYEGAQNIVQNTLGFYDSEVSEIMKQMYGYNSTIVKKFLIKTGHRLGHFHHYSDALKCYEEAMHIVESSLGFYHSEVDEIMSYIDKLCEPNEIMSYSDILCTSYDNLKRIYDDDDEDGNSRNSKKAKHTSKE